MSLIKEINRTETEKNKTKQVAINIDNKLVELGGEKAIDLSDVPNKMEVMVGQYNKYAEINVNKFEMGKSKRYCNFNINLNFEPKEIYISLSSLYSEDQGGQIRNNSNFNCGIYLDASPKTFKFFEMGNKYRIFTIETKFSKEVVNLTLTPPSNPESKYVFNFKKIYAWG